MSAVSACSYRLHMDDCPETLFEQGGAWALLRTVVATCPAHPDSVSWVGRQWSVRRVLILREMLGKQSQVSRSLIGLVDDLKRSIADDDHSLCWTTLHSDFSYYADREDGCAVERCVARACMGEILTWGFGVPSGLTQSLEGAALAADASSGSSGASHLSLEAIGLSTLVSEAQGNRLSDVLNTPRRRA